MSRKENILDDETPEHVATLAKYFAVLLYGHTEYLKRSHAKEVTPLAERFRQLLFDFAAAEQRTAQSEAEDVAIERNKIQALLGSFAVSLENRRKAQEQTADDFNLLQVLKLAGKEIRHSMVLAWLLDADLDHHGTHAQGPLGFRRFLHELRLPESYGDYRYWVRREVTGDDAIVDIEIASRGHFLIHIENKIWSSEGTDQTNREWADVQRRALAIGLDPVGDAANIHALYLTPSGVPPMNPNFRPMSWRRIVRVLEAFAASAKPADVKLFALHYARGISRFVATQEEDAGGEAE